MVLKYGTHVTITPHRGTPSDFVVRDYGAFDKDHPQYGPADWIDIWDPDLSRQQVSGKGWADVTVGDKCPCPEGYMEVRRAIPVN
jgi:hypothetical protein